LLTLSLLTSVAGAIAAPRPCALLRQSEIAAEFDGGPVELGADETGLSCTWNVDAGTLGTGVTIALGALVSQPEGTGARRAMQLERKAARERRDARGVSIVSIHDLGDEAFFVPLTQSLVVRSGNRVVEVSLDNFMGTEDA
jgi:hypothetical protein